MSFCEKTVTIIVTLKVWKFYIPQLLSSYHKHVFFPLSSVWFFSFSNSSLMLDLVSTGSWDLSSPNTEITFILYRYIKATLSYTQITRWLHSSPSWIRGFVYVFSSAQSVVCCLYACFFFFNSSYIYNVANVSLYNLYIITLCSLLRWLIFSRWVIEVWSHLVSPWGA